MPAFDQHSRGEFNEFNAKVKAAEQPHNAGSGAAPSSIDDGSLRRAHDLNLQADNVLASTEEKTDGMVAVVQEAATLVHEETSKKAIENLSTSLSDAAGANELFKLLYEPFLQTPIEEFVKRLSEKLFESTK